ncbi:MAG: bacteriorhodopsin [Myxococcota bacterium]|jgi:bacteriorhodopsin
MSLPDLTIGQFDLVYNMLSLAIAAMLASFAFFVMARQQLAPKYRPAMIMSSLVVGIAGYHYWRIFNSWEGAFELSTAGMYVASGEPFNDAYRYVDWLLTVPLLVAELVAVLTLPKGRRGSLMGRLIIASALMIGLGYPGEVATDATMRVVWAVASTIPFTYILYVLWVELTNAAASEDPETQILLRNTKLLLILTWGFYPIAYALPLLGIGGAASVVALQVGYSVCDIAAKCGYGVMIYSIAKSRMAAEGIDMNNAPVSAASSH